MTQLTFLDDLTPAQEEQYHQCQEDDGGKAAQFIPAAAEVHVGPKIAEYRRNVWNLAAQRTLAANPALAQKVVLAFILAGDASHIKDYKLSPYYQKITGEEKSISDATSRGDRVAYALGVVDCLKPEEEIKLLTAASIVLMPSVEEGKVKTTLQYLGVDLGNFWTIGEDFLSLLTKTEIEGVAKELGIDRFMGSSFSRFAGGKKGDFVTAIMKSGFNFTGKVPAFMFYKEA